MVWRSHPIHHFLEGYEVVGGALALHQAMLCRAADGQPGQNYTTTMLLLYYVVGSRCGGRDCFSSGVMDHDCCPATREETVMTTQRTWPPHTHETTSSAIDYHRSAVPLSCHNFNSLGLFHGVRRVVTRFPCCCFHLGCCPFELGQQRN